MQRTIEHSVSVGAEGPSRREGPNRREGPSRHEVPNRPIGASHADAPGWSPMFGPGGAGAAPLGPGALGLARPPLPLTTRVRAAAITVANPHCRQILAPAVAAHFADDFAPRPFAALPRELRPDAPRIPYHARGAGERTTEHRGQRKLFLAEVDFLTRWTDAAGFGENHVVVYAGAAPGFHIPALAGLFWTCHFLLYDPAPFCRRLLRPPPNVEVHQAFFTDAVAADLAARYGDRLVFICDARTGRDENYVQADMERQKTWTRILNPTAALLKFRLPWGGGETPYFDGTILLQAYPPQASTETRLAVTRAQVAAPERLYDNLAYEEQLAYHNAVGRVRTYPHGVQLPGLDNCFDCATAVRVAAGYMACSASAPPALSAAGARAPPRSPTRSPTAVKAGDRGGPDAQAAAIFLREALGDFEPAFREVAAANPAEHRWSPAHAKASPRARPPTYPPSVPEH